MNGRNAFKSLAAIGLVILPIKVSANAFRLPDQDAFATARGEAFVATADNPSAIYYNPAGITQLEGSNLRGGAYSIYLDPTFRPPSDAAKSGNTYHIKNNFAVAPQLFYTHKFADTPVSVGLGIYAPFGLSVNWPQDTGFRAVATKGALTYIRINPVVAFRVTDTFSFGGGITVNYANMTLEQGLRVFEQPLTNFFRFAGDGWCLGYNLGALWQPCEKISLGATFRSSTTVRLNGHTEFEQQPLIGDSHRTAHSRFNFPMTFVSGISFRPTPKWNIEFDADYTDWSSVQSMTIHQTPNPPFPIRSDIHLDLNWQPSWLYEFGVTRYFDNGWHASAGYAFNENSVPDSNYTPLVADLDRHFFSIGAGHKGKRFNFDVAYQFGYGPARTVKGSTPSTAGQIAGQTADGKYDFISHAVILSVGANF